MMDQSALSDLQSQPALKFKDYEKLCHWITRKLFFGGSEASGLTYEDVFQEVALLWCKCRDNFDPSKGVKFSAYFARSALPQRALVRRRLLGRDWRDTESIEKTVMKSEVGDDLTLFDVRADPRAENPEAELLRKEAIETEFERNPLLARLVEISAAPSEEIAAQLKAMEACQQWAATLGVKVDQTVPSTITLEALRKIFRLNWRQKFLSRPICGLVGEMP